MSRLAWNLGSGSTSRVCRPIGTMHATHAFFQDQAQSLDPDHDARASALVTEDLDTDAGIPLYPAVAVYLQLMIEQTSRINACRGWWVAEHEWVPELGGRGANLAYRNWCVLGQELCGTALWATARERLSEYPLQLRHDGPCVVDLLVPSCHRLLCSKDV